MRSDHKSEEDSMSVFGNIVSAVFGHKAMTPSATPPAPKPAAAGTPTAAGTPATGKQMTHAEVEAMIAKIAASKGQKYNWQQSIVDLMTLLGLDSSLNARKELAQELGYKGALNGSAEMNIWLHKQVMTKLAESGGTVPESLKHA
jgi:Domain of unknown function (DUF3597)